jgi:hypothetical protein
MPAAARRLMRRPFASRRPTSLAAPGVLHNALLTLPVLLKLRTLPFSVRGLKTHFRVTYEQPRLCIGTTCQPPPRLSPHSC